MINIKGLQAAFEFDQFEPSVRHIRFPHFKNLEPYLRIDFSFPITALVGPNGSNKSSVLRALACCPQYSNLGDFWFSTDVDPIDETGGRPRYIFGYKDPTSNAIVEVIQTRISKADEPDYWEPSRPLVLDGMTRLPKLADGEVHPGRTRTRWKGIKKEVLVIDFRNEISAFDKLLYHGQSVSALRGRKPKKILRQRSVYLKRAVNEDLKTLRPFKGRKEQIFSNIELSEIELRKISDIVGREYVSIKLILHDLFENSSYTAIIKTRDLSYSEAFAGSGEFAVIILVHKILKAKEKTLIVIDEPEVSLHPGAQSKLIEFLSEQCIQKKHQIFIGTHSKSIIDQLPENAIVLLQQNLASGRVVCQQNVKPNEAFFHLGLSPANKKKIFVEDLLAKEFVRKALRLIGEAAMDQFEIIPYPGGAKSIFTTCMPGLFQTQVENVLFLLDGDQKPQKAIIPPANIPELDTKAIKEQIRNFTGAQSIEFSRNGGNDPNAEQALEKLERGFLDYIIKHTSYLPDENPEVFIWNHMEKTDATALCENEKFKEKYAKLTRLEKGLMNTETVTSAEILETQVRKLATISPDHPDIVELSRTLRKHID